MTGNSVDTPQVANLTTSSGISTVNGIAIDMDRFIEASKQLGVTKGDVVSIRGHRDAHGKWVPDYDSIRVERRADDD